MKFHRPRHEGETLLIIDECGCMFNCRIQDSLRRDWCWFFTQHRKFGFNVILVSQFAKKMIDNQSCFVCVETEYRHRASETIQFVWHFAFVAVRRSVLCKYSFGFNAV